MEIIIFGGADLNRRDSTSLQTERLSLPLYSAGTMMLFRLVLYPQIVDLIIISIILYHLNGGGYFVNLNKWRLINTNIACVTIC